jgi:hypothetical protein
MITVDATGFDESRIACAETTLGDAKETNAIELAAIRNNRRNITAQARVEVRPPLHVATTMQVDASHPTSLLLVEVA